MAVAYEIVYTVSDDSGDSGTTTVKVPTGMTLAQYEEFAEAQAELLDAILSGKVEKAQLGFIGDVSGLTNNNVDFSSDVEEVASLQFLTSEGRKVNMNIPAMDENLVPAGSDDLNQADADLAALLAANINGLATAGGTISPCDVGEDDIVSTVFAREAFRASGKRR